MDHPRRLVLSGRVEQPFTAGAEQILIVSSWANRTRDLSRNDVHQRKFCSVALENFR